MSKVFIVAGATMDKIITLDKLPEPKAGTIFSKNSYNTIGSTGSGKAISLCKLGMDTTFHAMIGDDNSGEFIKTTMLKQGIKFIYDIDPKGTEEHVNLMDDSGNRLSIYTKYATFEPQLQLNKFDKIIKESDYIVINIINYARWLIPIAKKYKKEIWCDIHDYDGRNDYHREFIENSDYLFMSSDHMKDYKAFMQEQINKNKKLVVCTHGKNGVTALSTESGFIEVPILDTYERIDTNGAGDTLFSGFLYAYSKDYELLICLRYGTIAAGLCINSYEIVNPLLNQELLNKEYERFYRQSE